MVDAEDLKSFGHCDRVGVIATVWVRVPLSPPNGYKKTGAKYFAPVFNTICVLFPLILSLNIFYSHCLLIY